VLGADRRHDGDVANAEVTGPMDDAQADHPPRREKPVGQVARDLLGGGMAGVVEHVDRLAVVVLADVADEGHDGTGARMANGLDDLVDREGGVADLGQDHA
jgi:hypothetical protein